MTRDELILLEAKWRVGEITQSDLHGVADDLLNRGEDDPALIRLFALESDEMRWHGAQEFESLLRNWGGGTMSEREAVSVILRDLASGVVGGTIAPEVATSSVEAIWIRTNYQYDDLIDWRDLNEELSYLDRAGLSYLGRDRATVEADVLSLARAVLG